MMNVIFLRSAGCILGALSLSLGCAQAQEAAQQHDEAVDEQGAAEIIVTATRRAERLQDVPLSISAFDANDLKALGADGFAGFYRAAPGLSFNQGDSGRGAFTIRGINTGVGTGDNQAPVTLYIDELPTDDSRGARTIADLSLFDVERVEVLRGPQGTLFGSGALGGAIRVVTNTPDPGRFAALVAGDYGLIHGGEGSASIKAMLNVPLVNDRAAIRVVGYYRDTGGYIDNIASGRRNVNGDIAYGGRAAVKFALSERLSVTATAIFQKSSFDESGGLDAVRDGQWVRANRQPNNMKARIETYNLRAQYDLGWATLLSSTTRSFKRTELQQGIEGAFHGQPQRFGGPDRSKGFAQELRLTSSHDGPFNWVVGAFHFQRKRNVTTIIEVPGAGVLLGLDSDILQDARVTLKDTERALYGEASYNLTETLKATAGLRWFRNSSHYADIQTGPFAGGTVITGPLASEERSATPKFVLSYKPDEAVMIYVSAAKGYRIGGPNVPNALDPAVPHRYRSDSLWNYELGFKTSWLDRRLIVNAALYYIDWSEIQIERTSIVNQLDYLDNGGKARSKGIELELVAKPLRGLTLTSAASLSKARARETIDGTLIRFGDRLPGARDVTVSSSIEYQGRLSGELGLFLRADHQYAGKAYADFSNAIAPVLPAYHLVNLKLGATKDRWSVTLYADNVFNNDRLMQISSGGLMAYRLKPRTMGVAFDLGF